MTTSHPKHSAKGYAERVVAGDRRALSRLISWAENGNRSFPEALEALYPSIGQAWRVGITGPPGAGKSTLVNELALALRSTQFGQREVGILAIDPSSPFTGGALLGDRIRMEELTGDKHVYIRSMASRKSHGGMARAGVDACDVMDAFGMERILIETVGVGQAEYDVMGACDTVVVVMCPGAGDGVQAMKAGILEVADVLVVNKSDQAGAERLADDLSEAVHTRAIRSDEWLSETGDAWSVPVVLASAGKGENIDKVLEAVAAHRAMLASRGANGLEDARRKKRVAQVRRVVDEVLDERVWSTAELGEHVEDALAKGATAYGVANEVVDQLLGAGALAKTSNKPSANK
ncbi:MAG: methylmalonyl Co-A mutase-associated GTPase MeaB [Planctomycetota bacterium]|nr:methylmalonyl Co-A mutase-associated GTPase MeaB [Planctomycetota bacterium]MDG2143093.1 methylmalonyl Co-A mutase-associated GTPase MeaB [Planctomycetota bacterium]